MAGVTWSLSIQGRAGKDDHGLFLQTPDTPLCPLMDVMILSEARGMYIMRAGYQRVDSLFSVVKGKALFGYLPRA